MISVKIYFSGPVLKICGSDAVLDMFRSGSGCGFEDILDLVFK